MKKQLLFGLIIGTCAATHAQVVMENHVPPFGTTYTMNTVSGSVTPASEGASQSWTYASISGIPALTYKIVNPATLPARIKDSVPSADFGAQGVGAPHDTLAIYDFYKNETSHYVKVGKKSSGNNPVQKTSDTVIMFNHTYGNTLVYGGMNRVYCGYGTLTIKTKTYQNVVMIKSYMTGSSDTLFQFHQFNPHYQLLMSYARISGNIQNVIYWEPAVSTPTALKENTSDVIGVFPNPAKDQLRVSLKKPAGKLKTIMMDMQGKVVLENYTDQVQEASLDVSSLQPGMYILNIEADGALTREKILVE